MAAWTLALVWCVASSCGCPWWRGNPWPPGRVKGCWLTLKPQATKIQNEFLQPQLGRHARDRESSRSKGLTALSPFQNRAWIQGSKGIGPSQGTGQPSFLWAAVLWNERRPALVREQRFVPEESQLSPLLGGLGGSAEKVPRRQLPPFSHLCTLVRPMSSSCGHPDARFGGIHIVFPGCVP